MKKRAAIIPSSGIGDCMIFMIAAYNLHKNGYEVEIFHDKIIDAKDWCKLFKISTFPNNNSIIKTFSSFDYLIIQNDHSKRTKDLINIREKLPESSILFSSYKYSKHGLLHPSDYVFDRTKTMASNVYSFFLEKLKMNNISLENGMTPPDFLKHKKYKKRITICPVSSSISKDWNKFKYISLANKLKKKGLDPIFLINKEDKNNWKIVNNINCLLPDISSLSDFFSYIYESSLFVGNDSVGGHIASYFQIPHLLVSQDIKHMKLWKPGWLEPNIVFPPKWIPNFKFLRIKRKYWKYFITTNKVMSNLHPLISSLSD